MTEMKRGLPVVLMLMLVMAMVCGCVTEQIQPSAEAVEAVSAVTAEPTPEVTPEPPKPIYASMIAEGSYDINVKSSASMFRPVKAVLTVEDGSMKVCMTMSGKGYGYLYMGTAEQALEDDEETYIPFELDEDGAKSFTVPVEALNTDTACAAWSIRKERWYDRTLVFESDMLPDDAFLEG